MSDAASSLVEAASAVSALGASESDIDHLDEASLKAGMGLLMELDRRAQIYKLWFAAAIARQSDHSLGYDGLARRNGSATPAIFIQSITGSSIEEATKLARLGQSMVDAETATANAQASGVDAAPETPVIRAAASGGISVDAADAIRRGLGTPDVVVTALQLAEVADELIARANVMTPEALLKAARQARNDLDLDAIERGEKQRSMTRYVRTWSRDGMSGGSWALPDEDGGLEIHTALKLLVANKTGGPRFAEAGDAQSRDAHSGEVVDDTRTPEHIMADGFGQIFHNGLTADPSIVPGAGRAAVRVIVAEKVLQQRAGSATLEEGHSAISFSKLEQYLCEGGTIGIVFNDDDTIDVGREQRLYTSRQRDAMAVRDGGCRFPGCNKPPSWSEAHHIRHWARDNGRTDISNGILLCRYHHMLVHNKGWEIIRDGTPIDGRAGYWLKPPKERDPQQTPIAMPSKNPLVAAMKRAEKPEHEFYN